MISPDFSFEKRLWKRGFKVVVGLDEVGRGAWAGPLVVGGVAFKKNFKINTKGLAKEGIEINDSKKLRSRQRELASKWIKSNSLAFATSGISARQVDRVGISKSTYSGFRRVVKSIQNKVGSRVDFILIDAFYIPYVRGLRMPVKRQRKDRHSGRLVKNAGRQLAIIHGDEQSISVAAASIVAKVYRDKLMQNISRKPNYKKYGWGRNKGYGTKEHQKAIKGFGLTKYHRRTFIS